MTDSFNHTENRINELIGLTGKLHLDDKERGMLNEVFEDLKLMLLTAKLSWSCKAGMYASSFYHQTEQRVLERLSKLTLYIAENLWSHTSNYRHYYDLFTATNEMERTAMAISSCFELKKNIR